MPVAEFPLDIVQHIMSALNPRPDEGESWPNGRRKPVIISTLKACTFVSREFYFAARRELWRHLSLSYFAEHPTANTGLDRLCQVLTDNPPIRQYVRVVILDVYAYPGGWEVWGDQGTQAAFSSLTKVLTMLASAAVEHFWLRSNWWRKSNSVMATVDYDPEVLFALTALRCAPSLKECHFRGLQFKPPAPIVFGDPITDMVRHVSFVGTSYLCHEDGATPRNFSVPFDSPYLAISSEAYARTCQAIKNSTLPVPVFPRVTRLALRPFDFFWEMLQKRVRVVGGPQGDKQLWGGHLPSLQELRIRGARPGSLEGVCTALEAKPALWRVELEVSSIGECSVLYSLNKLPNLREVYISVDIRSMKWRPGQRVILNRFLNTMVFVLQDAMSKSVAPPFEVLCIELLFCDHDPHAYHELLRPHQDWQNFEDCLQIVVSRLETTRQIRVSLEVKMSVRGFSEEDLETVGEVIDAAPAILPEAIESGNVTLMVTTFG